MLQTFFGILPQICVSTQSSLGTLRTIPSTSWLGFCSDMHSTVGPYIDRCVPFQIMSNQLNLPHVYSNQVVKTSKQHSMTLMSVVKFLSRALQYREIKNPLCVKRESCQNFKHLKIGHWKISSQIHMPGMVGGDPNDAACQKCIVL